MRRTLLSFALTIAAASPLLAGAPSIRASLPTDHTAAVARGGFMIIRTFHHAGPMGLALHGTAEGVVNGVRTSVPLTFIADTIEAGVYLIPKTWTGDGPWVLNIAGDSEHMGAGLVIGVRPDGVPSVVETPRTTLGVSRAATAGEVRDLLAYLGGERASMPALADAKWRFLFTTPGLVTVVILLLPVLLTVALVQRIRRRRALQTAVAAGFALVLLGATPFGGPWISVEVPVNPYLRSAQGAFAMVRTYHHQTPMPFQVTGTAEGLAGTRRRSVALDIVPTGETGILAIRKTWTDEGVWVLKLGVEGMQLSAAIGVGANGELAFVRVPTMRNGGPRNITMAEVESLLRTLQAGERVPAMVAAR